MYDVHASVPAIAVLRAGVTARNFRALHTGHPETLGNPHLSDAVMQGLRGFVGKLHPSLLIWSLIIDRL